MNNSRYPMPAKLKTSKITRYFVILTLGTIVPLHSSFSGMRKKEKEFLTGMGETIIAAPVTAAVSYGASQWQTSKAWGRALSQESQAIAHAETALNTAEHDLKAVAPDYFEIRREHIRARDGYSYSTSNVGYGTGMTMNGEVGTGMVVTSSTVNVPPNPNEAAKLARELQEIEKALPQELVKNFHQAKEALNKAKQEFRVRKATFFASSRVIEVEKDGLKNELKKIGRLAKAGYAASVYLGLEGAVNLYQSFQFRSHGEAEYFPLASKASNAVKSLISPNSSSANDRDRFSDDRAF